MQNYIFLRFTRIKKTTIYKINYLLYKNTHTLEPSETMTIYKVQKIMAMYVQITHEAIRFMLDCHNILMS